MADEGAVDVDERRDTAPEGGTGHAPLVSAGTRLSPLQEAYGAYARHALACSKCRDIDRDRCTDGDRLWHSYHAISDQAYQRLAGGAS